MKETIETLGKKYRDGSTTVHEAIAAYVARAKATTDLNIYREIFDDINEQVNVAEKMFAEGTATALTGIPIAIKDNIMFAGHIAGASSKMLEAHTAAYDSTAVAKLKAAGAIIIGRTNMDDGAMGSSTENSAYGPTKNPLDPTRVPGGSSGGSAAAIAADTALLALGSDTGGSIRQPAAFCGIVGMLPTYGTVSRHGLIAMGSSLDVIGPFARTVADAKTLYEHIAGKDTFDATSVNRPEGHADIPLKQRIAIPKNIFEMQGLEEGVIENFKATLETLKAKGFEIKEVDLPHFSYALAVYYIIMPAEVSSNLARLDGIRYGTRIGEGKIADIYGETRGALFGKEVRRRILLGTYVLSHGYYDAYYNKAVALRSLIREELETALVDCDALLTPTTPTVPFKLGEKANDPLAMYAADLFTVPANIAQCPALAVPTGVDANGLPFSVQLLGKQFSEQVLFDIGSRIEK